MNEERLDQRLRNTISRQGKVIGDLEKRCNELEAENGALENITKSQAASNQTWREEYHKLLNEADTFRASNAALREALKEAQYVLGQHRVTGSLIKTIQKAIARTPADSLTEYRNGEAKTLRKNFAKYLAPIYEKDRTAIAILCDEQLDKTGNLLGYVREEAETIRAMRTTNDID